MGQHNDDLFKRVVTGGLQKQHQAGLKQGVYAMCKVVLDKANAPDKTDAERLEDIRKFCSVFMGQQTEEKHEV